MDQWNQSTSTAATPTLMGPMVPHEKGEVQYMMRQVTDNVRFSICDAIGRRPGLWDSSREKCNATIRKNLFGEVAEDVNQQYVLNPPLSIEEVEKHWKNLKDTYVKTRKKVTYDHEGCLIPPKWKFFDALMFLDSTNGHPVFGLKKRLQQHIAQYPAHTHSPQPFDLYPIAKKEKLEEPPTDEFMEFCRSLYLPLKEVGFKDRVQWLKIQKTIRDIVYEAQMDSVTKNPDVQ